MGFRKIKEKYVHIEKLESICTYLANQYLLCLIINGMLYDNPVILPFNLLEAKIIFILLQTLSTEL